jgi:glycosyltransferase involved in cell wall biosynthesis
MNATRDLVYVITGLNRAGAELVCLSQAAHFSKLGHRVGVIYLVDGHDGLVPEFEAFGVATACLRMSSIWELPQALWRCRKILREWRPKVVHSHMIHATILISLIKWTLSEIKMVATAHSVYEGGRLLRFLQRITRSAPDLSTNVSEEATQAYVAQRLFCADRAKCIPNGIDAGRFGFQDNRQTKSGGVFTYICVAQFRPEKNHITLLRAFSEVHGDHPSTQLMLLGAGPLLPECKALAETLGILNAVTFAGGDADVPASLRDADAFVLVSNYEGFGLAAAEAMAVGLPIVGADVPGLREVIGRYGKLVSPTDIHAIAEAMEQCMLEEDRLSDRIARRHHIVKNFGSDSIFAQWESEYRRLGL